MARVQPFRQNNERRVSHTPVQNAELLRLSFEFLLPSSLGTNMKKKTASPPFQTELFSAAPTAHVTLLIGRRIFMLSIDQFANVYVINRSNHGS